MALDSESGRRAVEKRWAARPVVRCGVCGKEHRCQAVPSVPAEVDIWTRAAQEMAAAKASIEGVPEEPEDPKERIQREYVERMTRKP